MWIPYVTTLTISPQLNSKKTSTSEQAHFFFLSFLSFLPPFILTFSLLSSLNVSPQLWYTAESDTYVWEVAGFSSWTCPHSHPLLQFCNRCVHFVSLSFFKFSWGHHTKKWHVCTNVYILYIWHLFWRSKMPIKNLKKRKSCHAVPRFYEVGVDAIQTRRGQCQPDCSETTWPGAMPEHLTWQLDNNNNHGDNTTRARRWVSHGQPYPCDPCGGIWLEQKDWGTLTFGCFQRQLFIGKEKQIKKNYDNENKLILYFIIPTAWFCNEVVSLSWICSVCMAFLTGYVWSLRFLDMWEIVDFNFALLCILIEIEIRDWSRKKPWL